MCKVPRSNLNGSTSMVHWRTKRKNKKQTKLIGEFTNVSWKLRRKSMISRTNIWNLLHSLKEEIFRRYILASKFLRFDWRFHYEDSRWKKSIVSSWITRSDCVFRNGTKRIWRASSSKKTYNSPLFVFWSLLRTLICQTGSYMCQN